MTVASTLGKKLGPLSRGAWLGLGAGGTALYLLYRRHLNTLAAQAGASTATTGGTTIPNDLSNFPTAPVYNTWADWVTAAVSSMSSNTPGLSSTDAFNAIQSWINGSCVSSKAYNALGAIIMSQGVPPGFGTGTPQLTACPTDTTTPSAPAPTFPSLPAPGQVAPNLSPSIITAMENNGEHLVSQAFDPVTNTWLYLTNLGGVYTASADPAKPGGVFYGSYLGLGPSGQQGAGPEGETSRGGFTTITPLSDGGYTLTDANGEQYSFGPTEGKTA